MGGNKSAWHLGDELMIKKLLLLTFILIFTVGTGNAADNVFDDNVVIGASSASDKLHVEGGGILQTIGTTPSPTIVGYVNEWPEMGGAHGVHVSGDYAYVSGNNNYVAVVDVSEPTAPTMVGFVGDDTQMDYLRDIYVAGKYAYVPAYQGHNIAILDVSDPSSPTVVGCTNLSAPETTQLEGAMAICVQGRYAYVCAASGDYFTIVDVSDPTAPFIAGSLYDAVDMNGPTDVNVSGDYAYVVAGNDNSLAIVDVSDPTSPTIVGSYDSSSEIGYVNCLHVSGRYVYIGSYNQDRLIVVDVSDPTSPTLVGSTGADTDNLETVRDIYVSGDYAYATCATDDMFTILDVSDPTSPTVVTAVTSASYLATGAEVFVSGKYAYVVDEAHSSLCIIDIFGIDASSASIGNISTSSIEVADNVDVGNNLYVRSGLNVGSRGIMTGGKLSAGGESYFGDKVGIKEDDPSQDLSVAGTFGIMEGTGATYYSIFQGGDQTEDITYTLPATAGTNTYVLSTNGSGTLDWASNSGAALPSGSTTETLRHNGSAWATSSALVNNGTNVGIGDASPAALLTVGASDVFQVNSSGAIAAATGITSSGTITFSGLTPDGVVKVASGALSSEAQLTVARGGTGQNFGSTAQGSILYFSGTGVISALAPGIDGQVLTTQGAGANPEWASADTVGPTLIVAASDSNDTTRADYVCSGSSDEVTIESAIAALPSGGGTVLLLEGTYTIGDVASGGVDITKSNVSIIGSGKSTILERGWSSSTTASSLIKIGDAGTTAVSGVVIASLAIDGQKATHTGTGNYGIWASYKVTQSRIQNNWVYDCDAVALYLAGASGVNLNSHILVDSNVFWDNDTYGCMLTYTNDSVFSNNITYSNTSSGCVISSSHYNIFCGNASISDGRGYYLLNSDYNIITGNSATGATSYGVYGSGSEYNTITSNNFYNNTRHIYLTSSSNYNTVSANKLHLTSGSSYNALTIGSSSSGNIVSFNDITDTAGTGVAISVDNANYLVGNRYSGTGASAITTTSAVIVQDSKEFKVNGTLQAEQFLTEAQNSGVTLTTDDFGKTITVDSSSTQTVSLPSVAAGDEGAWFRVIKLGAGKVIVDAADTDTIANSTGGGTISNSQSTEDYATITIELADTGVEWIITGVHGTWATD